MSLHCRAITTAVVCIVSDHDRRRSRSEVGRLQTQNPLLVRQVPRARSGKTDDNGRITDGTHIIGSPVSVNP